MRSNRQEARIRVDSASDCEQDDWDGHILDAIDNYAGYRQRRSCIDVLGSWGNNVAMVY